MPKLTKAVVDAAGPSNATAQTFIWDSEIKGFGLRITPAGTKSYVYQYRHAGRSHRIVIGKSNKVEPMKASPRKGAGCHSRDGARSDCREGGPCSGCGGSAPAR